MPPSAATRTCRKKEDIHFEGKIRKHRAFYQFFVFLGTVGMAEQLFTDIYSNNTWGSQESRSGPTSTMERTSEIRAALPSLIDELEIKGILDCGCGDWNWMRYVTLGDVEYLGVDIVEPLVEMLQKKHTQPTVHFQKMNVLLDPAETADLWLARDFCCLYGLKEIQQFFLKFLESNSKFLAITSVESRSAFQETVPGSWYALNLCAPPFDLPEPMLEYSDGQQWFRKKNLLIYNRQQILEWFAIKGSKLVTHAPKQVRDKQDKNAHLVSNVSLKDVKMRVHT